MTKQKSQRRNSVRRLAAFIAFAKGLNVLLQAVLNIVHVLKHLGM